MDILEERSVVVCGAHKGLNLKHFRREFPNHVLYALEPIKYNYSKMCELIRDKLGGDPLIRPLQVAAWTVNGTMPIRRAASSYSHSIYDRGEEYYSDKGNPVYETVETIDFAEFLVSLGRVDYIRMNIEGAEYEVVLDCLNKNALEGVGHLSIACHAHKIHSLLKKDEEMRRRLREWDKSHLRYNLYTKEGEFIWEQWKPSWAGKYKGR